MPTSEVIRKQLASRPILFIQRQIPADQLAATMAECFPRLFGHATQAGLAIAAQPAARYVAMDAEPWTVDFVLPLVTPAADEGEMQAGSLAGGPVAFAVHSGPYDELSQTHEAIGRWVEQHRLQRSGPSWEIYVTDPGSTPDPADWKTEVYWPLAD